MKPFISGGDMIETVTLEGSTYQKGPHKFEAGTPRIAEAFGWHAAVQWLDQYNMKEVHAHVSNLARWTAEQMESIPGIHIYGRHDLGNHKWSCFIPSRKYPCRRFSPLDGCRWICSRTGHHCAQPLMEALGVSEMHMSVFLDLQYQGGKLKPS